MAHYAFLDQKNIVTEVIAGRDENGTDWEAYYAGVRGVPTSQCRRTSYHTTNGEHRAGGTPFRENFAGVGFRFDPDFGPHGGFFPPKDPAVDQAFREAATL
jgi:hypothetical protein